MRFALHPLARRALPLFAAAALATLPAPAAAWTRQGHMLSAEIAFQELEARSPETIEAAAALLDDHPDRGPFQVAIGREQDRERARRLLLECSRWPDDIRGTAWDRPSWHAVAWPVVPDDDRTKPAPRTMFAALQAFDLNSRVLRDPGATRAERALALCWVMHLVGDIHQPLHTAQLFSPDFPEGDLLGQRQYVRAGPAGEAVSLHRYVDDLANSSDSLDVIRDRATALRRDYPLADLSEMQSLKGATDFARWAREESFVLATTLVYRPGAIAAKSKDVAGAVPPEQARELEQMAARRITLAGYRLSRVLIDALGPVAK